jgi:hypothetical protein
MDRFWMWLAWKLPRGLAKWAFVRVGVAASTGRHSGVEVPAVKVVDALARWEVASA